MYVWAHITLSSQSISATQYFLRDQVHLKHRLGKSWKWQNSTHHPWFSSWRSDPVLFICTYFFGYLRLLSVEYSETTQHETQLENKYGILCCCSWVSVTMLLTPLLLMSTQSSRSRSRLLEPALWLHDVIQLLRTSHNLVCSSLEGCALSNKNAKEPVNSYSVSGSALNKHTRILNRIA